MFEVHGKYTQAKVFAENVETECVSQIQAMTNAVQFTNPIAIMPDTHSGKGSVIGFTMPMSDKISPQVTGVDIGCGMLATNIGNTLPLSRDEIDAKIREQVPFGTNTHDATSGINVEKEVPWKDINEEVDRLLKKVNPMFGWTQPTPVIDYDWFVKKCAEIGCKKGTAEKSFGSLGGGNHFCEFSRSTVTGDYWYTIHSGSRNFGKCVCDYWQDRARGIVNAKVSGAYEEVIRKIRETTPNKQDIPARIREYRDSLGVQDMKTGLEYLEGNMAAAYLVDMVFAQAYANINRRVMSYIISRILNVRAPKETIQSVHNFIDFDDLIIRKGAIRSYVGEKMIVPFNMVDGIIICEGKSNPEWNFSAPHGAGRLMSRTAAMKNLDVGYYKQQIREAGIYSSSVGTATLDEAPKAYKRAEDIERLIEPTATIVDRLKPIIAMKDDGRNMREVMIERKKEKQAFKKDRREMARAKMEEKERLARGE